MYRIVGKAQFTHDSKPRNWGSGRIRLQDDARRALRHVRQHGSKLLRYSIERK